MSLGQLIIFEGADGNGKSHLATYLTVLLQEAGVEAEQFSFPGRSAGSLGSLIYQLHHAPEDVGVKSITPLGLQALHIAAHLDLVEGTILPTLRAGKWVLLDRYWWSTWVYGMADGANEQCLELLIRAEKTLWDGIQPAASFIVDRVEALRKENSPERFELLRRLYAEVVEREADSERTHVIDNNALDESKAALQIFAKQLLKKLSNHIRGLTR